MPPVRALVALLLLPGASTRTVAQPAAPAARLSIAHNYLVRTWETDQGLADNDVQGAAHGTGGYLWISTARGLMLFDGIRFTAVPPDPVWGAKALFTGGVFAASDGSVWAGVRDTGVVRLSAGSFEIVISTVEPASLRDGLRSFAEDADGAIWFTCIASPHVFRWKDGALRQFGEKEGLVASGAVVVRAAANGRIWFANERAFGWFDGDRFRLAGPPPSSQFHQIAPARDGGMWVTRYDVLEKYHEDGTHVVVADIAPIEGPRAVNQMLEDASGDLWLATTGVGLVRWRDGRFTRVPTAHNDVAFVTEDREGNLWAGTRGGGLGRIRRSRFALHQAGDDPRNDHVVSLAADTTHRLWLAPHRYPPVRALTPENHAFARLPGWGIGPINGILTALCPGSSGSVWIGTTTRLLGWHNDRFLDEPLQAHVSSLLMDRRGDLWIATDRGALVRRSASTGAFSYSATDSDLVAVRALAESADGALWTGTAAGRLFRSPDGVAFTVVSLPGSVSGKPIRFIVPDTDGALWIGVHQAGLLRWHEGSALLLSPSSRLPFDDLRSFAHGSGGEVWIGTGDRGLLGLARADLLAAFDEPSPPLPFRAPDKTEGVPALVFVNGHQNTVTRTRDGHLWIATTRGVLEIGPPLPPRPVSSARVIIERISLAGHPLSPAESSGPLSLPPQAGALEIRYTLPLLSTPERVRFRYRLRASDPDWIHAETQRTALFTRLPAGAYRFEVQAADGDSPWLPDTASLAFVVRAAWWETAWFRIAAALAAATALAAAVRHLVRRRLQARLRALEQRHAVEQERARLARDLHDQVGANLTQIALLADLASAIDPDGVSQLADAARQAVEGLDAVVWAADPRNDTLDNLLHYLVRYTEDFLKPTAIRHRIDFPLDVPARSLTPDFRHHVLLSVKEALNNAVKYSDATELRLGATLDPHKLALTVIDNGRGFDPVASTTAGNGLRHLRERAAALGGEARIGSGAGGTRILLTFPWPAINPLTP